MRVEEAVLAVIGLSSGVLISGGVAALMTGLEIIVRFAGISRTAGKLPLYEKGIFLGTLWGTLMTVFPEIRMPFGLAGLGICGFFMGIFVGGWILALAELANVFPVFSRRLGLTRGAAALVISLAAGKTAGSLYLFFMRWGKG